MQHIQASFVYLFKQRSLDTLKANNMKKSATIGATIKKELTAAFKGIKFSVRYSSFAGGDSVDISWSFGPTVKEVEAISNKYQAGTFNGMTDSYEYAREGKAEFTAKYVQTSRTFSNEFKLDAAAAFCEKVGIETQRNLLHTVTFGGVYVSQIIHRILYNTSFKTSNPTFKSVEHCQNSFIVLFSEVVEGKEVLPKVKWQLYPTASSTVECPVIAEATEIDEEIQEAYTAWSNALAVFDGLEAYDSEFQTWKAKEARAYKKLTDACIAAGHMSVGDAIASFVNNVSKAHQMKVA